MRILEESEDNKMSKEIKINYSVCNYIPSIIRNESVIFGIVVHCPSEEYAQFHRTKNLKRLRAFDDEYDKNYIDLMSETFSYYFDYPELDCDEYDDERFENITSDTFISDITKYYVNEFQFSEVRELISSNETLTRDLSDLIRTYLYYDRPKSERITTSEVKRLLNKELSNLNLNEYVQKTKVVDLANREIVDFEYGDTVVKVLSFDYKRKTDIVDQIKIFQSDFLDNKNYFKSKKIKIIMGNTNFDDQKFIDAAFSKLESIDSSIELIPIGEYTNRLIFEGVS